MVYLLICKVLKFLLVTYAGALSVLICIGIPIIAITSNKHIMAESAHLLNKQEVNLESS